MLLNLASRPQTKGYTKRDKKDWLDDLANWQQLSRELADVLSPLLAAVILQVGKQAYLDLGADPSMFDSGADDITSYVSDRSMKVSLAINDETKKQLRAEMSQGLDAEETDAELRARVEKVFGAALSYRSARTAQTEIASAQGFGDVAAWQQSGLVEAKEWYTAEDEKVCPWCASLDGAIMPLDEPFFRQGDTITAGGETLRVGFGDIHSNPLHVSCRCYLLDVRIAPI